MTSEFEMKICKINKILDSGCKYTILFDVRSDFGEFGAKIYSTRYPPIHLRYFKEEKKIIRLLALATAQSLPQNF